MAKAKKRRGKKKKKLTTRLVSKKRAMTKSGKLRKGCRRQKSGKYRCPKRSLKR